MTDSSFTPKPEIHYSRIFSASKIKLFDQCQKSFWFNYVDPISSELKNELKKLPENILSFQTLGKAVHGAITLFYHLPPEERNLENLKSKLFLAWQSEAMRFKKPPLGEWGGFSSLEEEREVYSVGLSMLKNFLMMPPLTDDFEFLPTDNLVRSIEDYHRLITPMTEDFDISGKFDLVIRNPEGSLEIVDFKTGKREEIDSFQMFFYKALAEMKFGKPVSQLKLYFLRTGRVIGVPSDDKTTEDIKKEIVEKVEKIRSTKTYNPNPTKLCKFCLFKNQCPEKEKVREAIKEVKGEDLDDDLPF